MHLTGRLARTPCTGRLGWRELHALGGSAGRELHALGGSAGGNSMRLTSRLTGKSMHLTGRLTGNSMPSAGRPARTPCTWRVGRRELHALGGSAGRELYALGGSAGGELHAHGGSAGGNSMDLASANSRDGAAGLERRTPVGSGPQGRRARQAGCPGGGTAGTRHSFRVGSRRARCGAPRVPVWRPLPREPAGVPSRRAILSVLRGPRPPSRRCSPGCRAVGKWATSRRTSSGTWVT